jgi:ATP-binding cassette subfamily B protein
MRHHLRQRVVDPFRTLGRILPLLWQSAPGWTLLATVLAVGEIVFGLAVLYLIKQLVDVLSTGNLGSNEAGHLEEVIRAVVQTGLATLGFLVARSLSGLAREAQAGLVADHVDRRMHSSAIAADLAFYESPQYFDTLQRARQSGNQRPAQVVANLLMLLKNLVMMAGITALLVTIHAVLLPILLIAIIPALLVRLHFTRKIYLWRRERTPLERQASYLDWLMTSDIHAKEIRLCQIGPSLQDRYSSIRTRLRNERLRINSRQTTFETLTGSVSTLIFFSALAFLAFETSRGNSSLGDLVLFLLVFQRAQSTGQELISQITRFFEDHLYISQLFEFLELEPGIDSPEEPVVPNGEGSPTLTLKKVSFTYPGADKQVLKDIDMSLESGKIVALVGANGCGKTTLIKLLCRLYDPTTGVIEVAGQDARSLELEAYRQQFSVIFQDYSRFHDTAESNIRFGDIRLHPGDPAIREAARRSGADDLIQELPKGYETLLGRMFEGGVELSLGQWQKIALARAFLRPSRFIILDEPTSAMDPNAESELFRNFKERIGARAALVISHRLSTIRMADYIYVLDGGQIVEQGTHEELMALGGAYHSSFSKQAENYVPAAEWTSAEP